MSNSNISFCEKCNNILEITTDLNKLEIKGSDASQNIDQIINNILHKEEIKARLLLQLSVERIKKSEKFKRLDSKKQDIVLKKAQKLMEKNKGNKVFFICYNCGNNKILNSRKLLYSIKNDTTAEVELLSDYSLICNDPSLPRTKNYNCPNNSCTSHDKKSLDKKEAVFFRPKGRFNLTYVCCVCKKGWLHS